jgi:hypothetical protein
LDLASSGYSTQRNLSRAVGRWFNDIFQDVTESEIQDLEIELKGLGLNLHVGYLNSKNPAHSFLEQFKSSGLSVGYSK